MRRALIVVAVLALAAAGCGHTDIHEVVLRGPVAPALRDPDVFVEGRLPAQPLHVTAMIQAIGFGTHADVGEVTRALVTRGRQLGCEALVRVRVVQGAVRAHGFAVCARYAHPPPPAPISPPPEAPPAAEPVRDRSMSL